MFSEYKNILANKFMRDTNYIIIKDTDDLDDLERQWELFQSSLTVRQQRLSDDRSIQIWDMTNQEHYEFLKAEILNNLQDKLGIDDSDIEKDTISYDPDDDYSSGLDELEKFDTSEISNLVNISLDDLEIPDDDNEISVKEDADIPTDGTEYEQKPVTISNSEKDQMADKYAVDSNINIIGSIKGITNQEKLENLEKAYIAWNSQNQDHRKKSDDKCREIYGMSNIDRYKKLRAEFSVKQKPKNEKEIDLDKNASTSDTEKLDSLGNKTNEPYCEFVESVYKNMQIVNETESIANKQHRRLNDTPYFTPSEMIDMGVHGNNNYYCKMADNDGLVTNVRIPTWFDSYKDMCMDHIFEDYTKDWINTMKLLYSDFEQIKESGDEEKITARKQSILDLGWNPEIPFTTRNRQLAAKRVSRLLDKSSPLNLFVKLDKEVQQKTPINQCLLYLYKVVKQIYYQMLLKNSLILNIHM